MSQLSKAEFSRPERRAPASVPRAAGRHRATAARVIVAWSPASEAAALGLAATQFEVELEAELGGSASTTWTCRHASGSGWAEALSSARCSEIVLTAVDGDLPSKHLILELAGLLTLKLAATQPVIRVRFLPAPAQAAPRARGRLIRCGTELKLPSKR